MSFAANHPGAAPFSLTQMPYGPQVLWPTHCVQGDHGAEFHADLRLNAADLIIRKGFRPEIDSYSGFFENDRVTPTGLEGYLRSRGVTAVTLVGLATDYCVAYSALDAVRPRVPDDGAGGRLPRHRPERLAGRGARPDARDAGVHLEP